MIRLYDFPQSPYCQKVRLVLAEKDLSYEKTFVDLVKNEQKSPDFLRLNPYGKVPVLIDDGKRSTIPRSLMNISMTSTPIRHLCPWLLANALASACSKILPTIRLRLKVVLLLRSCETG
jgi:glutaredoxin